MKYKTNIERLMEKALRKANIDVVYDFPIRSRWGFRIDFAIPEVKLAIECDGEAWHKNKGKDKFRDDYLKERGWTTLRFNGKRIEHNIDECIQAIQIFLNSNPLKKE